MRIGKLLTRGMPADAEGRSETRQAAAGARNRALLDVVTDCRPEITTQLAWLRMRMKAAAPQTLLVAP